MIKLTQDIAALTGLSILSLEKLSDKANLAIAHAVRESQIQKNATTEIDIGIGTLYIRVVDSEVKYKFIPSAALNSSVNYTICNNCSPLINKAEFSIKSRIEQSYKELL